MSEILVATSADFSLVRGTQPVAAGYWDDVVAARAFKRDEVTTDVVYLALTMRDGSEFLAHEDAPGWEEFLEAAEKALPEFPPAAEWLPKITRPAFARNETALFKR
ncbi:MAG: hypothetical protein ACJ79A_13920 [Gemmatimonadaceae bacterium]